MPNVHRIHSRRRDWRAPAQNVVLALAAIFSVSVVSCRGETPKQATVSPEVVAPPAPPAELSRFSVPVAYDIAGALRIVEQVVPRTFGAIDSLHQVGTDDRKHYAFEAHRGPFTGFVSGNELHLRATLAYQARGFFKARFGPTLSAGCGGDKEGDRPRVVVELATPLTLTEDWHLRAHAQIVRVEPASSEPRDHCDVSILHHDVTEQVVGAARSGLASQLPTIDRKINGVDLTEQVTGWWGILRRPIRLTDGVWLELAPERLRIGKLSGQSRTLVVPVSLDARPRIVTGSEPPAAATPLPPLGRDSASNGFHVLLDGIVDYAIASNTLSRVIGSRSFSQAGQTITLAGISVAPETRGRLGLTVRFTGSAKGELRLAQGRRPAQRVSPKGAATRGAGTRARTRAAARRPQSQARRRRHHLGHGRHGGRARNCRDARRRRDSGRSAWTGAHGGAAAVTTGALRTTPSALRRLRAR